MKIQKSILAVAGICTFLTGCVNPDGTQNNTGSGALIGGALGAVTGAAIGGSRHGGQDALIGAAAGAVAGGLVGNSMDREQEARLEAQAPAAPPALADTCPPMSVADVKTLAAAGVTDDVIINQIKNSRSVFHLNSSDIIELHTSGVKDSVITYMINTPMLVDSTPAAITGQPVVITQAPPPPAVETVVVTPGPGFVWVGGEWVWNGGWYWVGGHWDHRPRARAVWVAGHYWHDRHGWHDDRGHWR